MSRRGFSLIALIAVVLALGLSAVALAAMTGQSQRSSRWFQHAQLAHGLADAGLKEAVARIVRADSLERARRLGTSHAELFAAMSSGAGTRVALFGGALPPALAEHVRALAGFGPGLEVSARVVESSPLWEGELSGLAPADGERRGRLSITSSATVGGGTFARVARSVVLELDYKVVSQRPPLVGRFALFAAERNAAALDAVKVRFDELTGDGVSGEGPSPLVVGSRGAPAAVDVATGDVDRRPVQAADPVDRNGWIYLGGGEPWKLKLAHGYSDRGESLLLPGARVPSPFRSAAEDEGFRARLKADMSASGRCEIDFAEPGDGLAYFHHGFAENYAGIGGARDPRSLAFDVGPGTASCLRLFGTPDAFAPTVVFGPVQALSVRRASITGVMGPPGECFAPGRMTWHLLRHRDHGPSTRRLLEHAFGSATAVDEEGSRVVEEPFAAALAPALYAVSGSLVPDGSLSGAPTDGAPLSSRLLPWLGVGRGGVAEASLRRLWAGELESPGLFRGNLADGLGAFVAALARKVTFSLEPSRALARLVRDGTLSVPGVVMVDASLALGPIARIERGGVLIARGPITIEGDIARGEGGEPLTLVSLEGDIRFDPGVTKVEAYLVAAGGRVEMPPHALTVLGGCASRTLDVAGLSAGGRVRRRVLHDRAFDPAAPDAAGALRVCFGGGFALSAQADR